jgi:hypothetical protein
MIMTRTSTSTDIPRLRDVPALRRAVDQAIQATPKMTITAWLVQAVMEKLARQGIQVDE